MYKSTTETPKAPSASLETWKKVQADILPLVKEALKTVGYSLPVKNLDKIIKPKTLREYASGKFVYVKSFEFEKPLVAVFYQKDWSTMIDPADGTPSEELRVFVLKPCKNYADIYKAEAYDEYGPYLVPFEDFELVYPGAAIAPTAPTLFDLAPEAMLDEEDDKDENMAAMTIKDYLAIHQCVPVSNKSWLNDVIKKINAVRNKD